jgi:microsomal dipeptidase-like Zn-dependent dipeptidase
MGVVTKFTLGFNSNKHSSKGLDLITPLVWFQGWPKPTWGSLLERALHQAKKLEEFAANSQGMVRIIKSKVDLEDFLNDRITEPKLIGTMLSLEGVHALEGKMDNLDLLYDAGYRMIGLVHFFDNKAGGSNSGYVQGGLTTWGEELVKKAQSKGMVIDLAHASDAMIDDVVIMTAKPVVVSHTGVYSVCDFTRNIKDEYIQNIVSTGGVVGVAWYEDMIGGVEIEKAAKAIKYIVDKFGAESAAVGTDCDGVIKVPVDISGIPMLTEALLGIGVSKPDIENVYGENFLRVLRGCLL